MKEAGLLRIYEFLFTKCGNQVMLKTKRKIPTCAFSLHLLFSLKHKNNSSCLLALDLKHVSSLETAYTTALWPSLRLHTITHDWEPCQGNRCAKFQPPSLQASFHLATPPPCLFFLLTSFPSAYVSTHFFVVVFRFCLAACGRKLSSDGLCLRSAAASAWDQIVCALCVQDGL